MPKQIVILDPNGVEVATERSSGYQEWFIDTRKACDQLWDVLTRENPKLGTYMVTVKEVE